MNVQRSDSVLASFEKPVSASDAASVTVALRKRRERKEIEKRIVEARQDGSSLLLSELRSIDWQAAEKASSASSRKGGYGTDKNNARDDVIGNNPNILLVSIGCGALGLNLTAASTVILMDPWWQSTIEQQAIDRVHRIGQNRQVSAYGNFVVLNAKGSSLSLPFAEVFQMICKDKVEARVLEIQAKKEKLAEEGK